MDLFVSTDSSKKDESVMIAEEDKEPYERHFDSSIWSIFGGKVAVDSLEEMKLEWVTLMDKWHDKSQEVFLHKLKVIKTCFLGECVVLPSDFFQKFANLEKLVLCDSLTKQVFLSKLYTGWEDNARSNVWLKILKLSDLPILKHIVEDKSQAAPICNYLETFEVMKCNRLNLLVLSSECFQNLTVLEVSKCNGMLNLISSTAARSLGQLTSISIEDCSVIEEVIATEEDGDVNEIHFCQLTDLRLQNLPCLKGFCLGNCDLNFPYLEEVIVTECPKMKIFAHGVPTTPKLSKVYTSDDPFQKLFGGFKWEGSLNNTIQELCVETDDEEN